jgi:hypothetical protein
MPWPILRFPGCCQEVVSTGWNDKKLQKSRYIRRYSKWVTRPQEARNSLQSVTEVIYCKIWRQSWNVSYCSILGPTYGASCEFHSQFRNEPWLAHRHCSYVRATGIIAPRKKNSDSLSLPQYSSVIYSNYIYIIKSKNRISFCTGTL